MTPRSPSKRACAGQEAHSRRNSSFTACSAQRAAVLDAVSSTTYSQYAQSHKATTYERISVWGFVDFP